MVNFVPDFISDAGVELGRREYAEEARLKAISTATARPRSKPG